MNGGILAPLNEARCPTCNELLKVCTGHAATPRKAHVLAKDVPRYDHTPGCLWVLCMADDCECGDQP